MEKNDKRKIASSLTRILVAFLLISSWAVLGVVLALTTAKLQMGGVISFTANDISAKVTGSVTGAKTDYTFEDINISPTTTEAQLTSMQSSWNGWELSFDKSQNQMVISIRIQNLGDDTLWATVTDGIGSDDNLTITRSYLEYGESSPTQITKLNQLFEILYGEYLDLSITINIKDKTTKVGNLAFDLNFDLSRYEPDALDASFYPTLAFTYNDTNKTASVKKNSSNKPTGDLEIPSKVLHNGEKYSVTSVGDFSGTDITSAVIPEGVTSISDIMGAFSDCEVLESVSLPSTLSEIDIYSEQNYSWGSSIFGIFKGCDALKTLEVAQGNEVYKSYGNGIYKKDETAGSTEYKLILGCKTTTLNTPSTLNVKCIGDYAFLGCAGLTTLNIPSNISTIGKGAFYGCANLSSVTLSTGLTDVGMQAFRECTSLSAINLPSSITKINMSTFYGCSALKKITISSSIESIDSYAFGNCTSLSSVTFENTTGWTAGSTALSSTNLANTSTAATYLTSTYKNYTWTRTADASEYATLTFTYDEDNKTATVSANSSNKPTGDLVIPSRVAYEGEIYTVTGVSGFSGTSLTSVTIPESVTSISSQAFSSCSALESISVNSGNTVYSSYENGIYKGTELVVGCKNTIIKAGTTSIGESAFYGSSLTAINIPSSVETIDNSAFQSCTSLTLVTLSEGVTEICALAFKDCSSLTSINIPASVTSMELVTKTGGLYSRPLHIFNGCSSLESITVASGNTVYSSYGNGVYEGTKLIIGCKTTSIKEGTTTIGQGAFCDCTSLTSISIPEGVTVMKYGAFLGCTSLKSITLPSGMTELEGLINTGLESLEIPEGITELSQGQFSFNSSLTSVVIPKSVTCINDGAFDYCNNITSVVFKAPFGWSVSGRGRDSDGYTIYYGVEELSDPSNAAKIIKEYFTTTHSAAPQPPTMTKYANGEDDYPNLIFTTYNDTDKTVWVKVNQDNMPTGNLEIPSKIYYSKTEYYSVIGIDDKGFYGCTGLTSVTIPSTVTEIRANTFGGCTNLTSVVFENSTGWYAASNDVISLSNLETASTAATYLTTTYCDRVWCIPQDASKYTTLKFTCFDEDNTAYVSAASNKPTGDLIIPSVIKSDDGVYVVYYINTFMSCNLTSIYIPSTINRILPRQFRADTLTKIIVSEGNTTFYSYENGVYKDKELVLGCKTTIIKDGTTSIGNNAFRSAYYATSIVFPNTITSIGEDAFKSCKLESVVLPAGLISIGGSAFSSCASLTSITIPSTVTSIGSYAFQYTSLTSVTFENTYGWTAGSTELSSSDLADPSTAAVYLTKSSTYGGYTSYTWTRTALDASEYATLTFTYDEAAKTATLFANSSNKPTGDLEIPSSVLYNGEEYTVTSIKNRAFYGCTGLTSIKIPSTVTKISVNAFNGCTGLASITIPSSVTSIGQYAFDSCSGLTSITIPSSVTNIHAQAFSNCSSLESIIVDSGNTIYSSYENGIYKGTELFLGCKNTVIKADTTSIGDFAFYGCTGLTQITIPSNVTSIGNSTFQNCTSLASVTLSSNLETIGGSAFWGCSSLESITIPSSVTNIVAYSFKNCSALASVTFENPNGWMQNSSAVTSDLSDTSVAADYLKNLITNITRTDAE